MTAFIEGLDKYQALKIGDSYVVQLTGWYESLKHTVNSVEVSSSQVVVKSTNNILLVKPPTKQLDRYENDQGVVMDIDTYAIANKAKSEYWNEDADDYIYPDIESQIEILKLEGDREGFKPVYKDTYYEPTPVDITVIGVMEDTGSDFISTPFEIGCSKFAGSVGIYKVSSPLSIALDEFSKIAKENPEDKLENPTHSGLEYGNVNGKYVFNKGDSYISTRHQYYKVFEDLEEAKKYEEGIRKFIRSRVSPHLKDHQEVSKQERSDITKKLLSICSDVRSLQVKQKSDSDHRRVIKNVNELLNEIAGE